MTKIVVFRRYSVVIISWLGMRFWNQTFEEEITPKKGQDPEQEVQEIRQLLDESVESHQEESKC